MSISAPAIGRARAVLDLKPREQGRAGRVGADDRAAIGDPRRVHAPERPEQRLGRLGIAVVAVVQEADQRRDAQRARHQHHLVVGVAGQLAHLVQDRGGTLELGLGQPHLAHEAVQVAHQRDHDLAQPRIGGPLHDLDDRVRQLLLTLDDHSLPPACVLSQTALIGYRR